MKPSKLFIPLPPVDLNYELEHIVYYPTGWSKKTKSKSSKGTNKNVCVANRIRASGIPEQITTGDLHEEFSSFGPIGAIRIIRNKYRDRKGFALITFYKVSSAQLALKASLSMFIKAHRIYLHKAFEQPRFVKYDLEPIHRVYSNETVLAVNEKYTKLFLQEDIDSTPKRTYDWLQAIDSSIPHHLKRSTKCDSPCTTTETSSTSSMFSKSFCCEDTNISLETEVHTVLPVTSKSSESQIEPLEEFNLGNFHEIGNVEYPVSSDNQILFHNPHYFKCEEPENFVTTAYYDVNPVYQPIPQHDMVPMYQYSNYSYIGNNYLAPQPNLNCNPFYVYSGMFKNSLNDQFFIYNSPVYARVYNNNQQANDMQNNASREADSPYFDNNSSFACTNEMNNDSIDGVEITDASDEQNFDRSFTYNNVDDDDVSSDSDRSAEQYLLSAFQNYADSFVETLTLLEAFQEQFYDAPFQFLQPEEYEPNHNSPVLQSRLFRCCSKETAEDSNDSDSDDGITVEMDYFIDYDRYLKRAKRNSYDYSTSTQLNLFDQSSSLNEEIEPEMLDDVTDNKNTIPPEICNNGKDYYVVQVRDVATQFPEYDDNTFTQKMNELSLLDNETQTFCTPVNEHGESKALCLTYANATKCRKQSN